MVITVVLGDFEVNFDGLVNSPTLTDSTTAQNSVWHGPGIVTTGQLTKIRVFARTRKEFL